MNELHSTYEEYENKKSQFITISTILDEEINKLQDALLECVDRFVLDIKNSKDKIIQNYHECSNQLSFQLNNFQMMLKKVEKLSVVMNSFHQHCSNALNYKDEVELPHNPIQEDLNKIGCEEAKVAVNEESFFFSEEKIQQKRNMSQNEGLDDKDDIESQPKKKLIKSINNENKELITQ